MPGAIKKTYVLCFFVKGVRQAAPDVCSEWCCVLVFFLTAVCQMPCTAARRKG